jgi:hypothetical protein
VRLVADTEHGLPAGQEQDLATNLATGIQAGVRVEVRAAREHVHGVRRRVDPVPIFRAPAASVEHAGVGPRSA